MSLVHSNSNQDKTLFDAIGLAEKIIEVVPQAMRELRAEFRSQRTDGLSIPQFRVLARLRQQPATNKDLAEHIGLNVCTMSRMVDGLIASGLVAKSSGDRDRREVRIELSPAGQKLYASIRASARQRMAKRLAVLDPAEMRILDLGLEVLSKSLR